MLREDGHLNAFGEWLVHEEVKECLGGREDRPPEHISGAPSEAWIRSYRAGDGIQVGHGRSRLVFRGNRVDAILDPGGNVARARVDRR